MVAKRKALGSSPLDSVSDAIEKALAVGTSQLPPPANSPDAIEEQARKRAGDPDAEASAFIRSRSGEASGKALARRALRIVRVKRAAYERRNFRLRGTSIPDTDLRETLTPGAAAAVDENRAQAPNRSKSFAPGALRSAARVAQRTGTRIWGTGSIATVILLSLIIVFLIFAVRPSTTANGTKETRLSLFSKAAGGKADIAA